MRLKERYFPLCPCWIPPSGDPEGLVGSCEGGKKECRYPKDDTVWKTCQEISKGCERCTFKLCAFKSLKRKPEQPGSPVIDKRKTTNKQLLDE